MHCQILAGVQPDTWIVDERSDTPDKRAYAEGRGIAYRVIRNEELGGFPVPAFVPPAS